MKHERQQYGIKPGAENFPLMVVLSFDYACNAGCPNCPYNNSDIRAKYKNDMFMPEDIFKMIADECGAHGAYLRISGGGEPMLHPQTVELVCYAKKKNAKVGLITNGSKADPETMRKLIGCGIDNVEFSVDAGDKETYNTVRPGLDWNILNDNIKNTVAIRNELSAPTRIICSIINQKNVDVELAEKHWTGIVDKVQVRKFLTWGYNEDQSADDTPYLPPEKRIPCPWLFERLNIDSRGDYTICGEDIAFAYTFGNIRERSIVEVWNGPEFTEWRNKHLEKRGHEIEICGKCPDWQYRSWNYNYWKIIDDAEQKKQERLGAQDNTDSK